MNPKKLLFSLGGVLLGKWAADQFVLKSGPDDPTGFIEVKQGFGLDDVAEAAVIVLSVAVVHMVTAKLG